MTTNSSLLPHRPPVEEPDAGTRVVTLGTEEMTELCGVLASETATAVLGALDGEPMTASDVAERVDTSLQNAHYHLTQLLDADLVQVVDTWYSSRGAEMKVYAMAHDRLVLAAEGSTEAPVEPEPPEKAESGRVVVAGSN